MHDQTQRKTIFIISMKFEPIHHILYRFDYIELTLVNLICKQKLEIIIVNQHPKTLQLTFHKTIQVLIKLSTHQARK